MQTVRSKDGTTIAFDKFGHGQSIILVGGALNNRNTPPVGKPLAELLSANFTVFAYDRRGRGASGDTSPYAVEREIEDLQALILEAGGAANVFGLSSGAILALEAAAYGLNIKKLALFEPPFNVVDSRPRISFAPHVNDLIASGRRGDALEFFMTKVVEIPSEVVAQFRNAPMWPSLEGLAHTLVYDLTIVGYGSLPTERINTILAPALLIVGGTSPSWMRQAGKAVMDALPHGQVRILEGQNHSAGPEALAPVLQEFFED
ncbi:alpha/beta hydrolase [Paenibacillus sp. GP183]|uniref:alpha/beta fold hydrolase n=1 Tax=Paenibacillus sp. GP183 TaxID=1882751 RepID=UPI00089A87D7|nr:alpha/beta hydrolase [Paenibacillus sp. GP183]SEC14330.1 Pimeloyl-ACP methyl ester carboxylesterase [Paenibacillus sp. GP183]